MFFISEAFAQDGLSQSGGLMSFLPIVAIFLIFYFLMILPQQKKLKEHKKMVSSLKKGDKVITAGGVFGTIQKVDADDYVLVEVAPDVKIKVVQSSISEVLTKSSPEAHSKK